jgi:hypothetical protein
MSAEIQSVLSERQSRASLNGKLIETKVKMLIPEIQINNELIDAELNGTKVEIKSCQKWVVDDYRSTSRRYGRFCFEKKQHKELCSKNGFYTFLVHEGDEIFYFCKFPAKKLHLPEFSGNRGISWRTIVRMCAGGF